MPDMTRRLAFSRNTIHASNAVKTASRFSSRDADAAFVRVRPNISSKGPSTPPKPIASRYQNHSRRPMAGARQPRSRVVRTAPRPMPLPRYSSPASITGEVSCSNCLASGVLAPNNSAATNAPTAAEEKAMRDIGLAYPVGVLSASSAEAGVCRGVFLKADGRHGQLRVDLCQSAPTVRAAADHGEFR